MREGMRYRRHVIVKRTFERTVYDLTTGSVVAIAHAATNADEKYVYNAYGQCQATGPNFNNPYRYTGQRLDAETGLYFYHARFYNPAIGRFLQTDPVGYADGPNLYTYVGNNPLILVDPFGLCRSKYCEIDYSTLGFLGKLAIYGNALGEGALNGIEQFDNALTFGYWDEWGMPTLTADQYDQRYRGSFVAAKGKDAMWVSARSAQAACALGVLGLDVVLWGAGTEAATNPQAVNSVVQLTQQQQSSIGKINNIVRDHLRPSDIAGAVSDMVGNPIPKPGGGYYNHVQEVNQAIQGLTKHAAILQGVKDPAAQAARQLALTTIEQVNAATAGAGL